MPKVRLLELRNTYKWGGGPDKTILLSAERHTPERVEVIVAYIRDENDHEFVIGNKARARGLNFYEITEKGKFDRRVIKKICDIIKQHDINLIHAHDYKSDFFAYLTRLCLARHPLSLLSTAHAWVMIGLRGQLYRYLDLSLMRRFDHLIAVSHATKQEMIAAKIPEQKITVIHNGIDTEEWARSCATPDLRMQLELMEAFPVIGYVGRIMPEKDLDTWLRAAAIVAERYPKARFVLVGEGRDESTLQHLQELAMTLGIADRVFFPGYRAELFPVYASFDIFVLSSRREGLPNSILEAMSMELPVVTTDVAGAKELVVHNETGFVLPQGDIQGIAEAILALVANPQLKVTMARNGRRRVQEQFSFTHRMHQIEDLYEEIIDRSS